MVSITIAFYAKVENKKKILEKTMYKDTSHE